MQKINCDEILKATGGVLVSGNRKTSFDNICTDSRKVKAGDLFIPIKGERFDGHDFITQSLSTGAAGALSSRDIDPFEGKVLIKVKDTLAAMKNLASWYRIRFKIPFIGITGSVGKTSTKDMIASVLSQKFNVLKTQGNFNNEIGLPLTIFNLDCFHEAAVIEMGMSGFGEISRLTSIVKPQIAVITNIGLSHIEKLGSRQNILKAKLEILEGLAADGLVVLNGDDKLLSGMRDLLKFKTVFFGIEDGVDYQAYNIKTDGENGTRFEILIRNREYSVHVRVPGIHNVHNALAAIAVGVELGLPAESIIEGISEFTSGKMRMNIITHGNIKIIDDVYNASPQSMYAALDVLKDIGEQRRTIAVLGDMLEMGEWAQAEHIDIGKYAAEKKINCLAAVGAYSGFTVQGAVKAGMEPKNTYSFKNTDEAINFLREYLNDGDVILVKGSRAMKMEDIVSAVQGRENN
jgi:UDP-N-acetylmuramoyl-tripeptide--D-alanyl-D-alanine ligase